ncbi:propionyl-CoA carboxylase beta chain [Jatrophihabitans sp. GAS493]|nr:acyl-CoA carboxylase subunit beta [Jatrophihabitans sp. GAS493]SOD71630.1 propionyl-CoA carboxylase beta chain [Jatrophihabitans sp. GAS493]
MSAEFVSDDGSSASADGTPGLSTTALKLAHFDKLEAQTRNVGSARAVERQHAKGKLTARERIDLLVDPGSFVEFDAMARHQSTDFGMEANRPLGDGVVTGQGTVDGRTICLFSQDFTVFGGSLGQTYGEKIVKIMDLAAKIGCPIVGINDSGGARIQEGVSALAYYAQIGRRNARLSGVIPQISMILGPCAGGAVYSPAMTDFTVMTAETSQMFVTGPDVVYAVTGERTTFADLGGADMHAEVSGNTHYVAADEEDAFEWVRALLAFLPSNNLDDSMNVDETADLDLTAQDHALDVLVPDAANASYDMLEVFAAVADDGDYLEISPRFAPQMLCAFARVEGRTVGMVGNQPRYMAGTIDINASEKAARFIRFCDAFNLPILTFVDVPGYMPGLEQERNGIIRRGAKLLYAYSEATVPMVTVVVRKAYGGGYATMGSKHLGADLNFAWPTAEIAVMGGEGAVSVLYRAELARAEADGTLKEVRAKLIAEYRDTLATPYIAAERGFVDAVIRPSSTRGYVTRALRTLRTKVDHLPAKKHGNIPL